ncbi:MAG: glycine cleavage system protein GcvH [Oscillospiraceae bacterium]
MTFPEELKYSKSHEWVRYLDETTALVGITDFAQEALGSLVFVNLPQVGDATTAGEVFADVESVKAVSDIFCPVTGIVAEVNKTLEDSPEDMNDMPYETWMAKISDITGTEGLLDAAAYEKYTEEEA